MLISWTRQRWPSGSTPTPLEMLSGDQRFVDHPVAKSNSGEGAESVILTASLGIFDVTASIWAARPSVIPRFLEILR
jgi:hypothetical protein